MRPVSIIALYVSLWMLGLLLVLPFEARHHDEAAEHVPGEDRGAPTGFRPTRAALRATVFATVLFAAIYLNYTFGWITPEMVDVFGAPGG